jgi:hypothetical protein
MFHISHWMIAEQHRRLLGNDVNFIIFHDGPEAFNPDPMNELGTVPQVFGVVTPFEDLFRYGSFFSFFLFCLSFLSSLSFSLSYSLPSF